MWPIDEQGVVHDLIFRIYIDATRIRQEELKSHYGIKI